MTQVRALVIDDNAQNLKVLTQLLAKQGVECAEVTNPLALEDTLPTLDEIDVIFLDLEMPGIDGYNVKDMVRGHFGATPVIAYTVHVNEIHVTREKGFDGFLGKPLDSRRFPGQLERILRGDPVWERA